MSPPGLGPLFQPPPSRLKNMMATAERLPFSWCDGEDLPDLAQLRLVLDTLPDVKIVAALEASRGLRPLALVERHVPAKTPQRTCLASFNAP